MMQMLLGNLNPSQVEPVQRKSMLDLAEAAGGYVLLKILSNQNLMPWSKLVISGLRDEAGKVLNSRRCSVVCPLVKDYVSVWLDASITRIKSSHLRPLSEAAPGHSSSVPHVPDVGAFMSNTAACYASYVQSKKQCAI